MRTTVESKCAKRALFSAIKVQIVKEEPIHDLPNSVLVLQKQSSFKVFQPSSLILDSVIAMTLKSLC